MDTNHYTSKILRFALLLSISGIISHCSSQSSQAESCPTNGAVVHNQNEERCTCIDGTMQQCCRVRKDFASMSQAHRERYVNTVKEAQRADSQHNSQYNDLVRLHRHIFSTGIHQKDQFLPWHRWYILRYENLLRSINPNVTVPYWDWSLYSNQPFRLTSNSIWFNGASGLGGDGNPANLRCIADGPFSDFRFRRDSSDLSTGRCITRQFNGLPPDIIAVYLTKFTEANTTGFTDFELNLRANLHDSVHCRVSGIMCTADSAQAPEFFLHHGFIDKIWADWQEWSAAHMNAHFSTITSPNMQSTPFPPSRFTDTTALPDLSQLPSSSDRVCVNYEDPTDNQYPQIIARLDAMTRQEIQLLPRHSFAAVTTQQMDFFDVSQDEQQQATANLPDLQPENVITGNESLETPTDRAVGFSVESLLSESEGKRGDTPRQRTNTMEERRRKQVPKAAGSNDAHPISDGKSEKKRRERKNSNAKRWREKVEKAAGSNDKHPFSG